MNFKKAFSIFLFFLIGFICIYAGFKSFLVDKKNIADAKEYLNSIQWYFFASLIVVLTLANIFRALRWRLLLKTLNYKVSFFNSFAALMVGYLVNTGIPRGGEIVRCSIISKYHHIPFEKTLGTVVVERFIDMISLALIFLLGFLENKFILLKSWETILQQMEKINSVSKNNPNIFTWIVPLFIFGVLIFLFIYYRHNIKLLFLKAKLSLKELKKGLLSIYYLPKKFLFLIYTIFIWLGYLTCIYIGLLTIKGLSFPIGSTFICLGLASLSLIITPGGIGAYALIIQIILENYNCPPSIAFANGNLQWLYQFLIYFVLGIIFYFLIPFINRKKNENILQ